MGGELLTEDFKYKYIYKEILKSSAHDSLGGCNLDKTNSQILARNEKVLDLVNSYIDSMKRDIKETIKLGSNEYLIFNLAPFDRDISFKDVISTNNSDTLMSENGEILEYHQENISWKQHDSVYNHHISIFAKKVKAMTFKIIKIKKKTISDLKPLNIELTLKVENDKGDEFDFDFDHKSKPVYYKDFKHIKTIGFKSHKVSKFVLSKLNIELTLIANGFGKQYLINVNNKLQNKRVSLVFNKKGNVKLSRHLAIIEQELDSIKDWKELGYKDEPINFFTNDGLIENNGVNILTLGNNEVFINKDKYELTLYRAIGYLGKPDLSTRPGSASGLPMKCKTNDSQLQKELFFDLAINNQDSISTLNDWNFGGTGQFGGNINPILNNVERFVWNINRNMSQKDLKLTKLKMNQHLIGRLKEASNYIEVFYTDQKSKNSARVIWTKI